MNLITVRGGETDKKPIHVIVYSTQRPQYKAIRGTNERTKTRNKMKIK